MRRRTIILGGGALLAGASVALLSGRSGGGGDAVSRDSIDWTASGLQAGGTAGVPADLPDPVFREQPQCVTTLAQTLGPCHTNDVPIRRDVTEGVNGLPTRISLRLLRSEDCNPIKGADVEIWHADTRGVYSGRAAGMCNADDQDASSLAFLRGRQISDAEGRVNFLSIYPGWYSGRTVHVHLRIVIEGMELLVTQLLFDEPLSDIVYQGHPDYAARPQRDTMNGSDSVFSAAEASEFIFDVERLEIGILQASYTIGVAGA